MATLKKRREDESLLQFIERQAEEFDKNNPVVDTRWQVFEFTPGHTNRDDVYVMEKWVRLGAPVKTEAEALELADLWEPGLRAKIVVRKENLRRFTEERWVSH